MSFDLFFVAKPLDFAALREGALQLDEEQRTAHRELLATLTGHFANTRFVATDGPDKGYIADFPMGEMTVEPGMLFCSMHGGNYDGERIAELVDWFYAQGYYCVDPQGSGFTNRTAADRATRIMKTWSELDGAQLVGMQLDLADSELSLRFGLPDGSSADCKFVALQNFIIPPGKTIRNATILGVDCDEGNFDTFRFVLDNDSEILVEGIHFGSSIDRAG